MKLYKNYMQSLCMLFFSRRNNWYITKDYKNAEGTNVENSIKAKEAKTVRVFSQMLTILQFSHE